jgi:hypothetical protein
MHDKPQIESLSLKHRNRLFLLLLALFLIVLPIMIFYTTGYRLDLSGEEQAIVTTGGVYVTTDNLDVEVFLDDVLVERPRLFRSAYYIQNVAAGQHRIVVQRPDLHTWVKELPVDPHIVIEAAAFNMPALPHLRPITKFLTATGTPVYPGITEPPQPLLVGTSTVPFVLAQSPRTTTYLANEEYLFVSSLFSTSATATLSVFEQWLDEVDRFRFSTTTDEDISTTSEPVVQRGSIRLVEREHELYAVWVGASDAIPHYFCVNSASSSTIATRYGQHIADAIEALKVATSSTLIVEGDRLCRPEIRLDRLRQDVYFYDFFSNSSDLVLLQLEDGLYVTEIDDRSWQNVQRIYAGNGFQTVVENSVIYVHDDGYYFAVSTEITPL